jgi:16S rRNA (guanine1516-N2)-methyltransferase
LAEDRIVAPAARKLVERYGFPALRSKPRAGFYLSLSTTGLELREADPSAPGPVQVDFIAGPLGHRLRYGGGRGQALARAVGMKPGFNPVIWDATAGLGRDAFVLASLGSQVTLCERNAVLAALLDDGLQRAALDAGIGAWVHQRMQLVYGDTVKLLPKLDSGQCPDVVYMDPMYPPGKSSVLVKKEMRALQRLLGADCDSGVLLNSALQVASRRVVIKRPRHADWVDSKKPSTAIESKKTRYDIYVTL